MNAQINTTEAAFEDYKARIAAARQQFLNDKASEVAAITSEQSEERRYAVALAPSITDATQREKLVKNSASREKLAASGKLSSAAVEFFTDRGYSPAVIADLTDFCCVKTADAVLETVKFIKTGSTTALMTRYLKHAAMNPTGSITGFGRVSSGGNAQAGKRVKALAACGLISLDGVTPYSGLRFPAVSFGGRREPTQYSLTEFGKTVLSVFNPKLKPVSAG